jgi:ribosomal protein L24
MPIYRSGDLVKVKQGFHAGKELKVVEVKGSILILEDREGVTTELYADQVQKQMLFG